MAFGNDGRKIFLDTIKSPMYAADGTLVGVLGVARDVTEKRRNERLLQSAHERRRRSDLFNELIRVDLPDESVLAEIFRSIGNRIIEPVSCCLIVIDAYRDIPRKYGSERINDYHSLVDVMLDALEDSDQIAWESPEGIGVICFGLTPSTDVTEVKDKQKKLAEKLLKKIADQLPNETVSIGIAEMSDNLSELKERYHQAVLAVNGGCKLWPELTMYHYLDMGVYQILPCLSTGPQIEAFIERTLGKLLHYENRKNVDFMSTLETLLLSENLKESADKLSVHYQTLLFRKRRLEQILGVSFDNPASRMALLTALHLQKLK